MPSVYVTIEPGAEPRTVMAMRWSRANGEVGHDQEVAGVAHPADDVELVVQPGLEFGRDRAVAAGQAEVAFLAQPGLDRLAFGHREARDPKLAERKLEVDHLGDGAGPADGVEVVREEVAISWADFR
jgi:hypothetical protein